MSPLLLRKEELQEELQIETVLGFYCIGKNGLDDSDENYCGGMQSRIAHFFTNAVHRLEIIVAR